MPAETETPVGVDLVIRITSKTEVEAYLKASGSYPRSAPDPVWTSVLVAAAGDAARRLGMELRHKGGPQPGQPGTIRFSRALIDWEPL